ncbi:MAG: hypothetical protein ACI9W4_002791 [Rhodothermales bacterium]|jgi:hypothetical protein
MTGEALHLDTALLFAVGLSLFLLSGGYAFWRTNGQFPLGRVSVAVILVGSAFVRSRRAPRGPLSGRAGSGDRYGFLGIPALRSLLNMSSSRIRLAFAVTCLLAGSQDMAAQSTDSLATCGLGSAGAILEGGDVRAQIFNTGFLFFDAKGLDRRVPYSVPKDRVGALVSGAGLWLSGTLLDTLRSSVGFYGQQEFWPGPLDDEGRPISDCRPFDRIWSVSQSDLDDFQRTGAPSSDLASWPTGLGAPTLEASGQEIEFTPLPLADRLGRVIDLDAGERPYIRGDQTHWWLVNDVATERHLSSGPPLSVEVGVTAFAFDAVGVLGRTTFFQFDIRKPVGPAIDDFYVGLYSDVDLGTFDDDFMGSDSLLGLAYIYNGDDNEEEVYGAKPPAVGIDFLRGPRSHLDGLDNDGDGSVDEPSERLPMGSARAPRDTRSDPATARYYFTGRMRNGARMVSYDAGWPLSGRDDPPTKWQYWAEPGEFWSELNNDGLGGTNSLSDRKIVSGAGPVALGPGSPQSFLVAYLTSFGDDHIDSVRQLKEDDRFIQRLADDGILDIPAPLIEVPAHPDPTPLGGVFFPIPGHTQVTFRYHLPLKQDVAVTVFDLLGRRVDSYVGNPTPGTHDLVIDVSGQTPGVYIAWVKIGPRVFSKKLVVAR